MGIKPKLRKICLICKKEFFVIPSYINAKYCSKSCEAKRKRENMCHGERHYRWKGDKVQNSALHIWIRKNKLKPEFCEECHIFPPKEVANISGEYKRDVNDFKWLCHKCHQIMDKTGERHRRKYNGELALCPSCKLFKSKDNFWKSKHRWDKICIFCIDCTKKRKNKTFK